MIFFDKKFRSIAFSFEPLNTGATFEKKLKVDIQKNTLFLRNFTKVQSISCTQQKNTVHIRRNRNFVYDNVISN